MLNDARQWCNTQSMQQRQAFAGICQQLTPNYNKWHNNKPLSITHHLPANASNCQAMLMGHNHLTIFNNYQQLLAAAGSRLATANKC
jgi:hypothetical protein